jgi:uncharacterized membrane protein YjgN (DUF898 family)
MDEEAGEYQSIAFDGNWRQYAPIAFTNLLLIIVTLGFYRFWAITRTRQYLWSQTRFIDYRLEWSGKGIELFKGFIGVLVLFVLPYFVLNFVVQALALRGQTEAAGALTFVMTFLIFYLIGLARFRALRYRLSRTYWRGIRGGSEDPGFVYGWSYIWKNFVGMVVLGLLIPWSMVSLWNQRWNKMSFGPYRFEAEGQVEGLMGRFLLCYAAPFIAFFAASAFLIPVMIASGATADPETLEPSLPLLLTIFLVIFGIYFGIGLVVMAYYAKFFRQMVDRTTLHTLSFRFTASTKDWVILLLGDAVLIALTLGIGLMFIEYRHWKFMVIHLEAFGHIDLDQLTQSTTPELRQGEGLLDALDLGAF